MQEENLEKNLWKQVWTGNQMHVQRQDQGSNPGSVVHTAQGMNHCTTCFPGLDEHVEFQVQDPKSGPFCLHIR